MCYASPDGQFSLNDTRYGRKEKSCGAAVTRVQSAACNSVVLAAASDRHKNYSALRGYPLREKNGWRSSRKCGRIYSKIRITFFQKHHIENDIFLQKSLLGFCKNTRTEIIEICCYEPVQKCTRFYYSKMNNSFC